MANLSFIRSLEIPLPPLAIQQQIVAEIEGYQRIIDGARQVVEAYKPQIQIDPSWEMVALGDVCKKLQYGLSLPLNTDGTGYKTFRMNEIFNGFMVDNGSMKCIGIPAEEFEKYRIEVGDILFNRTNSYELVGKTGIYLLSGEHTFASYLIRLQIDRNKANPKFISYVMNTSDFQAGIKQYATKAIGQSNINAKSLANYIIPLPPLETQQRIVADIEREQALVNANKQLITLFEQKIKDRIAAVWGKADSPVLESSARPDVEDVAERMVTYPSVNEELAVGAEA